MNYLNQNEAIKKIETDPNFDFHSEEFNKVRNNKKVVLTAVSFVPTLLQSVSDRLTDDKEVVLAAIKGDPRCIKYASDNLQNDKEVVLAAVEQDVYYFDYASEEIQNAVGINEPVAFLKSAIEKEKLETKFNDVLNDIEDHKPQTKTDSIKKKYGAAL